LNLCAGALSFAGRYEQSLAVAEQQLDEAKNFRLDFVHPHAYVRLAVANLGLRRFSRAYSYLDRARSAAERNNDGYGMLSAETTRSIALCEAGRSSEALKVGPSTRPSGVSDTTYGEWLASRALALAASNCPAEARTVADLATHKTPSLEARLLSEFARIIADLSSRESDARTRISQAFREVRKTSAIDCFVAGYRTCPKILTYLVQTESNALRQITNQAKDVALARMAGLAPTGPSSPGSIDTLSPRESEVHDLLSQGFTNKEIANALFISESTVKVHVRRILEKLGVRSRTEAVLRTLRES
jgi:ATP/maltotriose-dependent transcriptional regulator MalT